MKKYFIFLLLFATSQLGNAQSFSEAAALDKAKREGISAADYAGYIKREKQRFETTSVNPEKPTSSRLFSKPNHGSNARTANVSNCSNLDFEDGDFNNWGIFTGINVNSLLTPSSVAIDAMPYTSGQNNPNGRHAIIDSANSYALWTPSISLVSNYSGKKIARLNDLINNAEASILERQFVVSANQPFLNFSYAAFLENAGHTPAEQPYISIVVMDSNGVAIPGTSLSIIATLSVNAGFTQVNMGGLSFFYKSWTPVVYNLSAYIGQPVTFQAIAADCSLGGHNGHAYFDFDCGGPLAGVANVWPGDANYDLAVDFLDLFYIGAGFGSTGSTRSVTGNAWAATPSNNWYLNSLYQVDAKHADCDGNGVIDLDDTAAVFLNYGLNHAFKTTAPGSGSGKTSALTDISIFPSANNVYAGQPLIIDFSIGDNTQAVDSIYAIGFTLDYPGQYLDNSLSALDCSGSVIDNSNANYLKLLKTFGNSADLALVKNNQQNSADVQGKIFSLNLRAATVITNDATFNLAISNAKAITRSGAEIPLSSSNYLIKFKASDATGFTTASQGHFNIFPNPASGNITIATPDSVKVKQYEIYSVVGTVLASNKADTKDSFDVDLTTLCQGAYIIQLQLENGTTISRHFIKL